MKISSIISVNASTTTVQAYLQESIANCHSSHAGLQPYTSERLDALTPASDGTCAVDVDSVDGEQHSTTNSGESERVLNGTTTITNGALQVESQKMEAM